MTPASQIIDVGVAILFAAAITLTIYAFWKLHNVHRAHRQRMLLIRSASSCSELEEFRKGPSYDEHIRLLMVLENPWRRYGALGARIEREFGKKV